MPQTIDRIDFACTDVDPSQWPKLSCGEAHQLLLEVGSLRLEADRALLFQDNGQIRSFDDNHRLVFNRAGNLLELHEAGDIRFLTGVPAPTEKLRIRANGNVGVGTGAPGAKLHVAGGLRTDGSIRVRRDAHVEGNLSVGGTVNLGGDAQAQGNLQVHGIVNAADIHKNGTPLRASQWEDVAGGINYARGNIGIGVAEPQAKLDVAGTIKGGGVLAGIWAAQPLTDVIISTSDTWQDVADTAVTFTLDRDATVFFTYSINVQPNGNPGGDWLGTRLMIDGTPQRESGSHFQPWTPG